MSARKGKKLKARGKTGGERDTRRENKGIILTTGVNEGIRLIPTPASSFVKVVSSYQY